MSVTHERAIYRFAEYEFVSSDLSLRRGEEVIAIARKPAQLLALLLDHRDRVVTREEILSVLWPDVRVSEAAFHSVVRDLRRAIGDDRREPRMVSTARGRGLRFVGAVEVWAAECGDVRPGDGAYVGRRDLLLRLRAAFEAASAGRGRVVLLGGIAGVGKTRTAKEIAAYARGHGAGVHYGRCWKPGFAPPYRPWVELLTSLLGRATPDRRRELLAGIEERIARVVPIGGAHAPPADGDESHLRFEVFDAVATLIERAARTQPLVLMIDDLEDGDPETLELLEFVASRIEDARVLVLGAYRAGSLDGEHPIFRAIARLSRLSHWEAHTLTGLDAAETFEFVRVAGPETEPHAALVDALHARSDGNPLLLGLLLRSDMPPSRAWTSHETIPALVRDWMRGSLLELPRECVEVLEAAAVIGRVFDDATIARMLGRDEVAVRRALADAGREGLVESLRSPLYRFAHALLQEAIYEDLPPSWRTELHRRAGEALTSLGRDELCASVARHLVAAAELVGEGAVDAAERAADVAHHQLAFEEAVRLREMALQALAALPHPSEARRCELLIALGRSQLAARRVDAAWDTARRAIALARESGTPEQFARAALLFGDYVLAESKEPAALLEEALDRLPPERTQLRGQVCSALSLMLWYQGSPERRLALAREARALARTGRDVRTEIAALLAERHALVGPSRLHERIELTNEALALAAHGRLATQECQVLSWRAVDLLESGDVVGAQLDADAVRRIVASGRAQRFRPFVERWAAMRAMMAGRFADAAECIRVAHERMCAAGDPNADAYTGIQTGVMLHEQGRGDDLAKLLSSAPWLFAYRERISAAGAAIALVELEAGSPGPARSLLERAAAATDPFATDPEALGTASFVAEICAQLGDRAHAQRLHERLAPYADRVSCFYGIACRGAFARYVGLLARTAGELDEAERCFEAAVATNEAIGGRVYGAWSLAEWAETVALREGEGSPRAGSLAAEAEKIASELGIERLLRTLRRGRNGPTLPGRSAS